MMLLQASIAIALIGLIGVTHSQTSNPNESTYPLPVGQIDLEYRPWDRNDTSKIWISLSGMGIETLNSMFRLNIRNLKWLIMDDNQIRTIPSRAFKSFSELTYISLVGNQIKKFESGAFDHLEKIQILDLDKNPLGYNPNYNEFDTLTGLKRLYLRHCQISTFDLPIHMVSLSHLYLSGNQLQMFYVRDESTLTYLHLKNNELWYVSLLRLGSLVYLDLSKNRISRIVRRSEVTPDYLARNFRRRNYYYPRNSYQHQYQDENSMYESGLYLDDASSLQHLIVSSNELSKIEPDTFLNAEALNYIDLSDNWIKEVYAGTFENLLQLENILLDSNHIKQINHRAFVNLPNLKTISLKDNKIDDIDEDAFTKLNSSANEIYLFLDNNLIHTLRRGSFRGIKGLKHIGLSNNKIKTISSETFVNLPNLDSIVIENQLQDPENPHLYFRNSAGIPKIKKGVIESDAFFNLSNLTSITIRGNLFTTVEPRAFHELPKLRLLDLTNNSIETLSSEAFKDLPAIENLYLGNNLISDIALGTFPRNLKHLNLASNLIRPNFSCWHVRELHHLEKLDVSGIIERFTVEDFSELPENLTVIVKNEGSTQNSLISCS